MNLAEKLIGGLIGLRALVVVVRDANGANQVLRGLADFNRKTFGTFIGVQ